MHHAFSHNYRNSSFIVDVVMGQIPRSTERFLVTTSTTGNIRRERYYSPAMNQAIVKQPIIDSETWQILLKVERSPSGSFT